MSEQNSRPQNSERPQRSRRPQGGPRRRRKVDYIAANHIEFIDYKNTELLERFISERGKILPRRVSGVSAKNQRRLTQAIKRSRIMGLLPFVAED